MSNLGNPLKIVLRKRIKSEVIKAISPESRKEQSEAVTKTVISSEPFRNANTISVYLSTSSEVDTTNILTEMFKQGKQVFVPSYRGDVMEMIKLVSMEDYQSLPLTKWNIKQPKVTADRENALDVGGIDLFLTPGVAFTVEGGRLGHGMGYYDKYFKRHFEAFPERRLSRKTITMGLAFREQIVPPDALHLDDHDVKLNYVVTTDGIFRNEHLF